MKIHPEILRELGDFTPKLGTFTPKFTPEKSFTPKIHLELGDLTPTLGTSPHCQFERVRILG